MNFKIPHKFTERGYKDISLSFEARDSVNGGLVFQNSTSDITVDYKAISIFIQTDKAIYQAGLTGRVCLCKNICFTQYLIELIFSKQKCYSCLEKKFWQNSGAWLKLLKKKI